MQSNNPILSRYESKPGQSGFAYQEGLSAYSQASGASPTAPPPSAPPRPQPQPGGPTTPDAEFATITAAGGLRITLNDVVVKTGLLFVATVVFSFVGWFLVGPAPWVMWVAMFGGLGLGLVNAFKREVSPALVVVYAVVQGLFLGGISNFYDAWARNSGWDGIVLQAVMATMVTFGVMLTLYMTGIVKVTQKFVRFMIVAAVSYLVIGLISLVSAMFGFGGGLGIYGLGDFGILVAALGVLLAAFFLMLDFEAIKQGIAAGLPERESWRMAFGLLVTIIWIYLEFLRLLSLIAGRNN
jgi:uncharacterized YccA/Bax inhibitor family protein